jgi:hypothetical protein
VLSGAWNRWIQRTSLKPLPARFKLSAVVEYGRICRLSCSHRSWLAGEHHRIVRRETANPSSLRVQRFARNCCSPNIRRLTRYGVKTCLALIVSLNSCVEVTGLCQVMIVVSIEALTVNLMCNPGILKYLQTPRLSPRATQFFLFV